MQNEGLLRVEGTFSPLKVEEEVRLWMACTKYDRNGNLYAWETRPYFVLQKLKWIIDSIDLVLKNLVKYDIPKLYPGEKNVILHFDSATAHVYPAVVAWLQERKVEFITKEDWMTNSPDRSPLH